MATPAPLFTARQLSSFIHYEVTETAAEAAERVVSGWLADATGLTEWPTPLPPQLQSWAIELGVIAHENPGGLIARTQGGEREEWQVGHRAAVLANARAWADRAAPSASTSASTGCFPEPSSYPEPARLQQHRW